MKKTPDGKPKVHAEPMPETDFSQGVRGKYYKRLRTSVVTVRIDGGVAKKVTAPARPPAVARSARGR